MLIYVYFSEYIKESRSVSFKKPHLFPRLKDRQSCDKHQAPTSWCDRNVQQGVHSSLFLQVCNFISVGWVAATEETTHSKLKPQLGVGKELFFTHWQQARKRSVRPWHFLILKAWMMQPLEEPIYSPQKGWGRKKPLWSFVVQVPAHIRDKIVVGSACSCMKQTCLKRLQQFVQAGFYVPTPF